MPFRPLQAAGTAQTPHPSLSNHSWPSLVPVVPALLPVPHAALGLWGGGLSGVQVLVQVNSLTTG